MAYRKARDEVGRLTKAIIETIGGFAFGKEEHKDSDTLDQSTDIQSAKEHQAILFYRILDKTFYCPEAQSVADIFERLNISKKRQGRQEAVLSLVGGKYPSGERVVQSLETLKKEIIGE